MIKNLNLIFACIFFGGLAFLSNDKKSLANEFKIGEIFEGKVIIKNSPLKSVVFLPPGIYRVVAYIEYRNNNNNSLAYLGLAKMNKNIVETAILVNYSIDFEQYGWKISNLCDRKNLHFIDTKANYNHEQDCYGLNHYRPTYLGSKNRFKRSLGEYLEKEGISQPQKFLSPFFRFADSSSLIEIRYFFNPEAYGFEKQERTTWKSSSWHPSVINLYPSKLAFKESVLDWTKTFYPQIKKAAFNKIDHKFKMADVNFKKFDDSNTVDIKDDIEVCDSAVNRAELQWSTENTKDVAIAKKLGYSVIDCISIITKNK